MPITRFAFAALIATFLCTQTRADLAVSQFSPAAKATDICVDTPLRITFASAPTLGTSGKIQIFDASNNSVVDSIDVSSPTAIKTIGGLNNYHYYPVVITGNDAEIYLKNGVLSYAKSYYVTIDAGVFQDHSGLTGRTWQFTTKAAPPTTRPGRLTVAADGTGNFCTVQGAVDAIPDGNTEPITIFIVKGFYPEMVYFANKHSLTFQGEDRKQTVIAYATNDRFNNSAGGGGYRRGVFRANRCNDLTLANLTIRNTTPQGGSQAECIIFNGTPTSRAIVTGVDLYSYQDTLQINGQAYVSNSYIEGDVDFMWGNGPCFFENVECKTLRSNAYYTQIRNPASNHGYVYYKCTFNGAQGIMGNFLSRIAPRGFPNSEVVLVDCVMTSAVSPVAWRLDQSQDIGNVHYWEFNSHTPDGKPVDTSARLPGSKQLKQPDDAETIANYSNPKWVLGNDWDPRRAAIFAASTGMLVQPVVGAPKITVQPADQLALMGTNPYLTVVANGSGNLKYQWFKNGRAIGGATSSLLRLNSAKSADAANYSVTVSNESGSTTSDSARLTMFTPATTRPTDKSPQLPKFATEVFDVTKTGAVGDGSTDNTAAIQKTIDAAVAAGGGIVQLPAADKPYLSGPIRLGNGVNFQLDNGAVLQPLPYAADNSAGHYPLGGTRYADFITANGAHDVAITGPGMIDGKGDAWWAAFRANPQMPHRPYMIRFATCQSVLLCGVKLKDSPMFHAAFNATDNLTLFGIHVTAPERGPNTDGIDPSGSHQLFQNLYVSVGDDNLVMKPGGAYCSDILVSDCEFGTGHGMSVGGQSNRGLDGMTVRNIAFVGTDSALRLKADPTQGGPVQNITYSNITMNDVNYPIVFYSYYNRVGNPGSTSGNNQTTVEKAGNWNANPPNPLNTSTMPSWKNITIDGLVATQTRSYAIIYGLPLPGYFIDNVKLKDVRLFDGPGLELYNATNIQFTGTTKVPAMKTLNTLAITSQPLDQTVAAGSEATFAVTTAGVSGVKQTAPKFEWTFNGSPLTDGKNADGCVISGATTATLKISNVQSASAGKYAVKVSNLLDSYDVTAKTLLPDSAPVSATSAAATLVVR